MSSKRRPDYDDDLLPEYDFSAAVRGKYYEGYRQGTNVVRLDPDVAAVFRDSASVNDTLRSLVSLARTKAREPKRTGPRGRSPSESLQPPSGAIRGARPRRGTETPAVERGRSHAGRLARRGR